MKMYTWNGDTWHVRELLKSKDGSLMMILVDPSRPLTRQLTAYSLQ